MFIDKIFKNKTNNTQIEESKEVCDLKTCPLYLKNIDELLQISPDEYILKENITLVRVNEEIYVYRNSHFELLKEPLSIIAKRNLNERLGSQISNYIDTIRELIMETSLKGEGYISLLNYNFHINDILNYGFDKFIEALQSDGSEFEVKKTVRKRYGWYSEEAIKEIDIEIKWL